MENEIWKPIKGFPNYAVSNFGSVARLKNGVIIRILKLGLNTYGYHKVGLNQNNIRNCRLCHRLVYEAFVGKIPKGMVVDHIDGVKTNNHFSNLRVCTIRENSEYYYNRIAKNGNAVCVRSVNGKWEVRTTINKKRKWLGSFDTFESAQEVYNNARKQ